jgi:hypothetical protein
MGSESESPFEALWSEYGRAFGDFDDLTLARWMAQTLGQFEGKSWRLSHPLLGAYRLAAQVAQDRQIWFKRLISPPPAYSEASCCRAPFFPLLTRDVLDSGLICQHCNETLVAFDDLPGEVQSAITKWATEYRPVHAVAHWDDRQRKGAGNYERAFESAAQTAEKLLTTAGTELTPRLLEFYPAVVWEDQDECLEIRPEDVRL